MYKVLLTPRAIKQIKALPDNIKIRVKEKLIGMGRNPLDGNVKKLKVHQSRYRLRVGGYRIIFDFDRKIITICALTVRHRKNVYR